MPTYQYRCKECDHELEVVQSFTDEPLQTCPECEGTLKKVYGNVGISFKGSGFYKTDSRGSSKKPAKAAAESSSTSDSSSTASSTSGGDSSSSSSSSSSEKASTTSSAKAD